MTLWAFVADVHGNYRALERAERLAQARGAERFAVLGDLVGRGQPAACVAWMRHHATMAVVGNRDLDHLTLVDADDQAYLRGLPTMAGAEDFLMTHGDARLHRALCTADERRGFRRAYAELAAADKRLWFFGHSHHARVWRKAGPEALLELLAADCVAIDRSADGVRYFVNVGTTGRPLGGRGPASFTLYDSAGGELTRVPL